jgi:hypothetical protein
LDSSEDASIVHELLLNSICEVSSDEDSEPLDVLLFEQDVFDESDLTSFDDASIFTELLPNSICEEPVVGDPVVLLLLLLPVLDLEDDSELTSLSGDLISSEPG